MRKKSCFSIVGIIFAVLSIILFQFDSISFLEKKIKTVIIRYNFEKFNYIGLGLRFLLDVQNDPYILYNN